MRSSIVRSLSFLTFSSLLISPGAANLNGKNPALESHALSHCIAADNSSSASGTTFFTSPLVNNGTTQLSWTLGVHIQNTTDDMGDTLIQIERDFYFGLGSDTGSIQNASFRACSIFYLGVSEPLYSNANSDGRRTQEVSEACVRDLTAVVNNTAQELMPQNDHDLPSVCKKLVETTTSDRPTSCQNYYPGELHVQDYTNRRNTFSASSSKNCHSSSGNVYSLTLVDSNSIVNTNGSSNLKNMVLGATPIITVFYPESNLSRPDIQYVAVKPEDTSDLIGQVSGSSASGSAAPSGSLASGFTASSMLALRMMVIISVFLSWVI